MNLEYNDIFSLRGKSYNYAMNLSPDSRKNEFLRLFDSIALREGEKILDVPSGGGYLKRFISEQITVNSLEFTPGFSKAVKVVNPCEDWNSRLNDRVVCLAALHHISDLDLFVSRALDSVIEEGLIHLADVEKNSPISRFLDEFVGEWTVGGHKGLYRNWQEIKWTDNLKVVYVGKRKCPWVFNSMEELNSFCRHLFYLQDCPTTKIQKYLENNIGVYSEGGLIYLNWELVYVDLQKNKV